MREMVDAGNPGGSVPEMIEEKLSWKIPPFCYVVFTQTAPAQQKVSSACRLTSEKACSASRYYRR